ncbi:hypothetical protein ASD93_04445 [Microbacterium sp. Root180]|nr:hypothetical protein ASD93_04445 [Microbacterium sp. Root180]
MLVNMNRRLRSADEGGSALVSVLVIMLVLSIAGMALAAIVTNTTMTLVDSRSTTQSRASADAGLADAVGGLRRGTLACGGVERDVPVDSAVATSPTYSYRVVCGAGLATVTATGEAANGMTTTQAVYRYTETPSSDGDMVFFGTSEVKFSYEVRTSAPGRLLKIVVPQATFTCQALIPGNITVGGNIAANGGCTIKGDVNATGTVDMCCGSDTIEGDLSTSGTGSGTVRGTVLGDLHANGTLEFGWEGKRVGGAVTTSGNVKLGNVRIDGSLTMPTARTYTPQSGTVTGGVVRLASVPGPTAPTLPAWFEYKYKTTDFPGYNTLTLVNSGSGPGTCNYFNSSPGTGWTTSIGAYTVPTVIDARACSVLSSNMGAIPVIPVKTNIVFLAKKYDLTALTMKAATGLASKPKVWFITEDINATDAKPTCGSGYGPIGINGTVMATSITAMAYSPCAISVSGGASGISDKWNGAFYGGGWNYGGGIEFTADPIGVPGMSSSSSSGSATGTLGSLVSQRDIAPQEIP